MSISVYQKYGKRLMDAIVAITAIVILLPVFIALAIFIKLDSPGSIIFQQKRAGKGGRPFTLYKFRTMVAKAEQLKTQYLKLNEANGPVFKIKNDPRYTKVGKFLSHTGLDELPQVINILKGEMSLVGPRPLPVEEEEEIPLAYQTSRRSVKPGLTSSWLVNGSHRVSFEKWMKLDLEDIKKCSLIYDLEIFLRTVCLALGFVKKEATKPLTSFSNTGAAK